VPEWTPEVKLRYDGGALGTNSSETGNRGKPEKIPDWSLDSLQ
jgi:hypothetical protein